MIPYTQISIYKGSKIKRVSTGIRPHINNCVYLLWALIHADESTDGNYHLAISCLVSKADGGTRGGNTTSATGSVLHLLVGG